MPATPDVSTSTLSHPMTIALTIATAKAIAAYPSEQSRILRAADLCRKGYVEMHANEHYAIVHSGSQPGKFYTVNGSCQCQGYHDARVNGRCSHRYAKSLMSKAQALYTSMHYATLYNAENVGIHGVTLPTNDGRTAFFIDDSTSVLLVPERAIHRHGICSFVDGNN